MEVSASTYGIFPIGKPIGPVLWIATNHGDESIADEPHHKKDLEDGQVKLGNSKVPDAKAVESSTMSKLVHLLFHWDLG